MYRIHLGFSSHIKMIKQGLMLSLCIIFYACSGGHNGGASTPAPTTPKIVVDAGADINVDMLQRVDLNPKVLVAHVTSAKISATGLEMVGNSLDTADIVSLTWSQIEGPALALHSSGLNDGKIYFNAPATGSASSVTIVFKLILVNAAGTSAEDTTTIKVNKVIVALYCA